MKLRYTYGAREDLLDIWAHIATESLLVADRVFDRLEDRCAQLLDHPRLGPARPEIAEEARLLVVDRWLVLYRLMDDGVQVVRIVDSSRDLTEIEWKPE